MRLSLLALLTAAVLVSAPPLPAQEVRPLERVSLRTDQALDIFLDVIRDSKEKKDWPRALRALEEIERFIRTNGDEYILPVSGSVGSDAGTLYTGAREAAFRELATFPPEALAAWRISADCAVGEQIEACRLRPDALKLEKVLARYPLSSHSPEALELLAAIYLERGDYARALRTCSHAGACTDFLAHMPPSRMVRFELLRLVSLKALTGAEPEDLSGYDFILQHVPVKGEPKIFREALAEALNSVEAKPLAPPALSGGVGAEAWSTDLPPEEDAAKLLVAARNSRMKPGLRTAPAVSDNRVFYCDENRLVAIDAASGAALWSYTAAASPTVAGIHNAFFRPAAGEGLVAASLGRKLHVLDASSGKLKWSAAPGQAEDTTHTYLSPPAVSGRTVLVCSNSWGKELTCRLSAYDLENGRERWNLRIVTGFPTDTFGLGSQPGVPVVWGGAAYVVTNLGAAVCADVENGRILWLRRYNACDSRLKEESIANDRRWALVPPVMHRGVLVCAPQDSPFVFASDAVDGTLLWREPRVGLEEFRHLGGASDGLVFAAGSAVRAFHCRTGKVAWTVKLPAGATGPAVTFADKLIIPCGRMLTQIEPSGGKSLGNFLLPGEPETSRHLTALRERLLLSTPRGVQLFNSYKNSIKTGSDSTGLLTRGVLQWRSEKFDRGIETLESVLSNLSDDDPLKIRVAAELHLATGTAAASSKGSKRAGYLETSVRYSSIPEQPSLLLEAAKEYESAGLLKEALRMYREVILNHQARNVVLAGHKAHADDYARICEKEILLKDAKLRSGQEMLADRLLRQKNKDAGPHGLFDIIRGFPNSEAAAKAYVELGRYCIKEKLLESAELYLGEFLAKDPDSPHADQARVLLCTTYLNKGDLPRAKQILLELWNSESEIRVNNVTRKASEYARAKLSSPDIAKVVLSDSLLLPVSRLWQTTPCLAQSAPNVIGASADGRVLFTLGPNLLDCRSATTGELLARFDLSAPPESPPRRTGVVVPGGVVILRGKRLIMVGTEDKEPRWKWGSTLPAPDPVPGISPREDALLARSAGRLLVLWPRNRLMAFDEKTGENTWTYKSSKRHFDCPVETGGKLVLVQADGTAAVGLDPKTGAASFTARLSGRAFTTSSLVPCGDRTLVVRGSRDTYCLGKNGALLWSKKSDSFLSSPTYLAPDKVALMPGPGAGREVICLNLADGEQAWKSPIGEDTVTTQLTDEKSLYLAQRPRFGVTSITAIDGATGKRRWLWRQPEGGYAIVTQTPDHLIVWIVDRARSDLYLVDKARGVREQAVTFPAEMYQSGLVHDGRLYVTTDRCAYCLGHVRHARAREEYLRAVYRLSRTPALRTELEKVAAGYARFQTFDNSAEALDEIVRSNWKLTESEIRRLVERSGGFRYGHHSASSLVIDVPKMERPVRADGILDDGWAPALATERGVNGVFRVDLPRAGAGEWFSKHDLSASFYFGWDKKNFYLALDVRDSITRPWDRDDKEFWKGDFLLVALDPLGDGGWTAGADDILLSMGLVLPRRNMTQEEREEEERNKPKGEYFVKRREDSSGAVYEAKIPWELFNENGTNIDPQKGPPEDFSFGLDLVLLDDDTGGGTTKTLNLGRGLLLGVRRTLWRGFVPRKFATMRLKGK